MFSILLGSGIGLASSLFNFWLLKKGMRQDVRQFLAFLMGGIAFRIVSMVIAIIVVFKFVAVEKIPFSISLLTVVFLGILVDSIFAVKYNNKSASERL